MSICKSDAAAAESIQVLVVPMTEQPFSCMASKEQVLGYLATHTDWLLLVVQDANLRPTHGEHSGQVRWSAGVIAPPVSVYY